jgi:hypothetical protein
MTSQRSGSTILVTGAFSYAGQYATSYCSAEGIESAPSRTIQNAQIYLVIKSRFFLNPSMILTS